MKMDGHGLNTSVSGVDDERHDPGSVRAFHSLLFVDCLASRWHECTATFVGRRCAIRSSYNFKSVFSSNFI